jgi:spermidine/putrescine transport system substrate-binding protein
MTHFKISDPRGLLRATRRDFVKGTAAIAAAAATGLAGIGTAYADDKVLNLLCWPGHGDPAFVKPFEDKYGVKVVAKEYVGGEPMLALMNQSPPGTFDVVLADAEYIHMLQEGNLIEALNPADFPLADYWQSSSISRCIGSVTSFIRCLFGSAISEWPTVATC